jgi:hypothetical protein
MNSQQIFMSVILCIVIFVVIAFTPLATGVAYITFWKGRDPPSSGGSKKYKK